MQYLNLNGWHENTIMNLYSNAYLKYLILPTKSLFCENQSTRACIKMCKLINIHYLELVMSS